MNGPLLFKKTKLLFKQQIGVNCSGNQTNINTTSCDIRVKFLIKNAIVPLTCKVLLN